jgi:uncharacterized protein (DUF1800 family)
MKSTPRKLGVLLLVVLLALSAVLVIAADRKHKPASSAKSAIAANQMDESKRAQHALNRLTFGPRPGDVDRISAMGVDKWIEQQLHPEKIDDSALETRLSGFRTLRMDARAMVENFPPPQVLKAVANGRVEMPSDPNKRAVYQAALDRYETRQNNKAEGKPGKNAKANDVASDPDANTGDAANKMDDPAEQQRRRERRQARMEAEGTGDAIMSLPADKRMAAIVKLPQEQRRSLMASLPPEERQKLMAELSPEQRETLMAMVNPQQVINSELSQAKLLRAAYSERQLEEVMTDFWFNHFNVFLNKGADRYLVTQYERDVIRAHSLGKFKDLLVATAKSPAMLFYLDNWQSVGPHSDAAERGPRANGNNRFRPNARFNRGIFGGFGGLNQNRRPAQREVANNNNNNNDDQRMLGPDGQPAPPKPPKKAGLNENYGRELMELHTLGVDGGYTQKDVTELAKILTGWTIRQPRMGGGFDFNGRTHEPGTKYFLGQQIKEDGENEGMKVLDILAHHPSTAKFISRKLAMRFVADNPPPALVDRMAETFQKTDGDVREVLRTMFRSPEFWAPEAYRAKVKTPLEFVASALRATGVDVNNALPMVQALNQMGMPLYLMQPPTGYSMKAETWVNSAALLGRMNFALRLASGRLPGVQFDPDRLLPVVTSGTNGDAQQMVAVLENALLAGDVSQQTHHTILKQLSDPDGVQRALQAPVGVAPASDMRPGDMRTVPVPAQARQQQGMFQQPTPAGIVAGLILGSPEFQRR